MNRRGDSPLDSIVTSDGDNELYHETNLNLNAVVAMCDEIDLEELTRRPRGWIDDLNNQYKKNEVTQPDWLIAGVNCAKAEMILPIVIHTYLQDWRLE